MSTIASDIKPIEEKVAKIQLKNCINFCDGWLVS